jgi:hypothetical protein
MLEKKGDLGRYVIPIAIGPNTFEEVVCDFGASVNIMPKVIYEKIHGDQLLYTTMCLQLADQSLCYPKGILEDVYVRVGHSYVPTDFVVVETGGDEKAPIILGQPFLRTTKAIIYIDFSIICVDDGFCGPTIINIGSPYLLKQDDPGVPTIECTINQRIFHKTFCNTRSGVNIMAKVTYEYLFVPHLCAAADGGPNILIPSGDSKGCHGANS